jgi:hypothetical protein
MDVDEPYSQHSRTDLPDTNRHKPVMLSDVHCWKMYNVLIVLTCLSGE